MQKGYMRPQMAREGWTNLNGMWDFAFDDRNVGEKEKWNESFPAEKREINVPFSYETKMSGIGDEAFHPVVWYEREVALSEPGKRQILHFEGVDYTAKVWVNGCFAGTHTGAYARFSMDITDYVVNGVNKITVRAEDSMSCIQPRGKQRWKDENFGCWYVQTTGIWKTVWLESVPRTYIEKLKITPDLDNAKVGFEIKLNKKPEEPGELTCRILLDGAEVRACSVKAGGQYLTFDASVADEDAPWHMIPWSPQNPKLYDVELTLIEGEEKDVLTSYFGMRKISIEGGQILLNNRPLYQRLILDQGYWEESHLTPPSEEALVKDIDLVLEAGYNGVRKHEKVEDERFLYWCDRKGLLVWCEMPSVYAFQDDSVEQFTNQWMEIVRQNYNHPCIVTWTAFNESWGIERIYTDSRQQKFTEGIYHLTKTFDPLRPVIVNDGWEHTVSDIVTLHDYEELGEILADRYRHKEAIVNNEIPFNRDRYAMAKGYPYQGQPILISEYGGIAFQTEDGWGYGNQVADEKAFLERFRNIAMAIKSLPYSVGFCYTQVTDVQQEVNGLYTSLREPKVDIGEIREINLS
nr:sugar-binding domain-containing protein [uncultured Acetatifactor sp.]